MAAVEQQGHNRNGEQRSFGCQQGNQQILSGAGINRQAGEKCPRRRKTGIAQHHAKGETDEQIAAQHRDGGGKSGTKCFFHEETLFQYRNGQ